MLACVSMSPDGGVYVNEGTDAEGNLLAQVPPAVMVAFELFSEMREGFSYEEDSTRVAEMLLWQLEDRGHTPADISEWDRIILRLCSPGPAFDPADYIIELY